MPSKYKRKSSIRDPYKKIIIAMEGNRTEPLYFNEVKKEFRSSILKVELLTRDESDTRSAPKHVIEQLNRLNVPSKTRVDEMIQWGNSGERMIRMHNRNSTTINPPVE